MMDLIALIFIVIPAFVVGIVIGTSKSLKAAAAEVIFGWLFLFSVIWIYTPLRPLTIFGGYAACVVAGLCGVSLAVATRGAS